MNGFAVSIDQTEMTVLLKAGCDVIDSVCTREELVTLFMKNNIVKGIINSEISRAFEELPQLKKEKVYLVARGKEPVAGRNGEVHFTVNVSGRTELKIADSGNDSGNIDYKNTVRIESVKKGSCLCYITKPTAGIDGYSLSGQILVASDGHEAVITLGKGTEYNNKRDKVFATSEGRPIFVDKILSVSPVYEIRGDVCFATGNVYFDGHVSILGAVNDDFRVEAQSIDIGGVVGSCIIKSKDDLFVYGGVNGHGKAHVVCNGNASIKYLNDVDIEVDGDLIVAKEIVNCNVKCNGRVIASRIIGGTVSALKGIEVRVLGSEIGTPTLVEAGVNYHVKAYDTALQSLSWRIEQLLSPFQNHMGDHKFYRKVTKKVKERILKAYEEFKRIRVGYLKLLKDKMVFMNEDRFISVCEIIVLEHLFSDVSVATVHCFKEYFYDFLGPLRLVENINSRGLTIESYDPTRSRDQKTESVEGENKGEPKVAFNAYRESSYTKEGLDDLDKEFNYMLYGQRFSVCIVDNKYGRRVALVNALKTFGVDRVFEAQDSAHAVSVLNGHTDKKVIIICDLHIGKENGMRLVTDFLHKSKGGYGILLADHVEAKLEQAIAKIGSIALLTRPFEVKCIIDQIRDFGFYL